MIEVNHKVTRRVAIALAESIGTSYENYVIRVKSDGYGHCVGNTWSKTISGVVNEVLSDIELGLYEPDYDILKNATYSDGVKCFTIKD